MPKRSISQRIGEKAELICETLFVNAPNWVPRKQDKDFGVDLEVELTTQQERIEKLTGKLIKIQVKGSVKHS